MAEIKITNMLKFYTLCLLATGPKHGYDLIKELEEKLGRRISASNIYPFLSILSKNKLIAFLENLHNPITKFLVGVNVNRDTAENIKKYGLKIIKEENLALKDVFKKIEAKK